MFALSLSVHAATHSLPCAAPCFFGPQTVSHSGILRYYAAYFPVGVTASTPYPLLVVLNGANIVPYNNPKLDSQALLQFFADANNVAVLWVFSADYDTGSIPGSAPQPYQNCMSTTDACQWVWRLPFYFTNYYTDYDDIGYITDRITNAENAWGADGTRILLVDGSTGGIEAHAYAQANPGNVLAVGTFAGPVWAQSGNSSPSPPTGNVNVFMVHGDSDETLPYCGGLTSEPWYGLTDISTASADQTFDYWTGPEAMNCASVTPTGSLCPLSGGVMQKIGSRCNGGKSTMFIRETGANHLDVSNFTYQLLFEFWNFVFPPIGNPTTSTVSSNLNPSSFMQPVIFNAAVSSNTGTPTGNVTFVKNGFPFGTATLNDGKASLAWTLAEAGTKAVMVYFSGNANFAASSSLIPLVQQVNPTVTTTALASLENPSVLGQTVTFTATVSAQYGSLPIGAVTFSKNGVVFATEPLVSGQATTARVFYTPGEDVITADYSGSLNFGSSSGSLNQTVNQE